MFTLDQIGEAIRKVKSFNEYPSLLDDFRELGIVKYDNFNDNGLSVYYGKDNFTLKGNPKFKMIEISDNPDSELLKKYIISHKNEETSFHTFSREMAEAGAKVWSVDVAAKEITYYDKNGFEILRTKV